MNYIYMNYDKLRQKDRKTERQKDSETQRQRESETNKQKEVMRE